MLCPVCVLCEGVNVRKDKRATETARTSCKYGRTDARRAFVRSRQPNHSPHPATDERDVPTSSRCGVHNNAVCVSMTNSCLPAASNERRGGGMRGAGIESDSGRRRGAARLRHDRLRRSPRLVCARDRPSDDERRGTGGHRLGGRHDAPTGRRGGTSGACARRANAPAGAEGRAFGRRLRRPPAGCRARRAERWARTPTRALVAWARAGGASGCEHTRLGLLAGETGPGADG